MAIHRKDLRTIAVAGMVAAAAVTLAGCGRAPAKAPADAGAVPRGEAATSTELHRVLDRLLAPPAIRAEPGFTARVLIGPGESQLYDPLFMRDQAGTVWINDDGGQKGERGGQILAIDRRGQVSTVVALGRLLPLISFDIARASFAPYQGQIFTLAQVETGQRGLVEKGHIVQRVDPRTQQEAETFCTLPPAGGTDGKGIPTFGMEGRFGPEGSPFAGKFFAVAAGNRTVYQVTADGRCRPFVTFDPQKWSRPFGLTFAPDGQHMLVSTGGTIARVRPDGTVEAKPLVRSTHGTQLSLLGMAYAPAGFGAYAGQLFVVAIKGEKLNGQKRLQTHTMPEAGEVYRLTPEGELKLVALGFRFPVGVHFVGDRLWVSDINGDFIGEARRELPDGFLVEITPAP